MTDSPSALLERAATLIEQRAAAAAARPEGPQMQAYAAWWVWLSPFINAPEVVAQPLVEWLRDTASWFRDVSSVQVPGEALMSAWMRHPAVRFAHIVLCEVPANGL